MELQQPPYNPQDLLDAVIDQRNGLMNEVAMARSIIKAKEEEIRKMYSKDDEIARLKSSELMLKGQRDAKESRIAELEAELAALKERLAAAELAKPADNGPTP